MVNKHEAREAFEKEWAKTASMFDQADMSEEVQQSNMAAMAFGEEIV